MTLPGGPDQVNPDAQFGVTGDDGSLPGQTTMDQPTVEALLKAQYVRDNPSIANPLATVFSGLRSGVSMGLAIIEGAANALQDADDVFFLNVEEALQGLRDMRFGQGRLDIPNVQQIVDNIVQGGGIGSGIGNAVDGVLDSIGGIFNTANRADQNVIDVQASVQQLVDENNSGTTGNRNSVVFSGADGAPLTGFTVGPGPSDIVIRADSSGNTVAGLRADAPNGRYWAVFDTTQYATTDQSVSGVLGRNGSEETSLTLFCRADPTATNGAYCNVRTDRVDVGYFSRSGTTFTFNQFVYKDHTVKLGSRVELRSEGATYRVLVNGVQVIGTTDTGNHVTIGPSNVCSGFVLSRVTTGLVLATVHHSFWLASFAMADYAPGGTSAVPSWHLTRSSTTSVALSLANGSVGVLPAGFLTLEDAATDVEVPNLGQGIVKILKTGWYEIDAAAMAKPSDNTNHRIAFWYVPHWALFKNGAQLTGPLTMGVPKKVHLLENNTVQAALVAASTTPTAGENEETDASTTLAGVPIDIAWIRGFASFSGKLVP